MQVSYHNYVKHGLEILSPGKFYWFESYFEFAKSVGFYNEVSSGKVSDQQGYPI